MSAWKSMETAPKDGTKILIRDYWCSGDNHRIVISSWRDPDGYGNFNWYVFLTGRESDSYPTMNPREWTEIPE